MKKLLIVVFSLLLMSGVAKADPFLTCDPSPDQASHFKLKIDGVETEQLATDAEYKIWYNLKDIPIGEHTIQAQFGKVSQNDSSVMLWSDWAPAPDPFVYFGEQRPGSPTGFAIRINGGS